MISSSILLNSTLTNYCMLCVAYMNVCFHSTFYKLHVGIPCILLCIPLPWNLKCNFEVGHRLPIFMGYPYYPVDDKSVNFMQCKFSPSCFSLAHAVMKLLTQTIFSWLFNKIFHSLISHRRNIVWAIRNHRQERGVHWEVYQHALCIIFWKSQYTLNY